MRKINKLLAICTATALLVGLLAACGSKSFVYKSTDKQGVFQNNFFTFNYDEELLTLTETAPKEGETTALISLAGKEHLPRLDILNVSLSGLTTETPDEEFYNLVLPVIKAYYASDLRDKITFGIPTVLVSEQDGQLDCTVSVTADEYKAALLPKTVFDVEIKGKEQGVITLFIHGELDDTTRKPYTDALASLELK